MPVWISRSGEARGHPSGSPQSRCAILSFVGDDARVDFKVWWNEGAPLGLPAVPLCDPEFCGRRCLCGFQGLV